MSNINKDYIKDYIMEVNPKPPTFLEEMHKYAINNHIPIVDNEVAQLLNVLIKIKGAKNILEIGAAIGYSAILMSNAMEKEGIVTTIERREDMINLAKENIKKYNLENRINLLEGEAQNILPNINNRYDFIFIDAAKGKYMEFLPSCIDMLKKGGVIVSDNVLFKGMVANDDLVVRRKKTIVRRMREYLKYISDNPILETSILPVGDGVAISYKKEEK
ncbi:MAG: O-methyltransferase [Firmicutes bacterium]|nr:O-methyltransferase [Bacillota bacterium]